MSEEDIPANVLKISSGTADRIENLEKKKRRRVNPIGLDIDLSKDCYIEMLMLIFFLCLFCTSRRYAQRFCKMTACPSVPSLSKGFCTIRIIAVVLFRCANRIKVKWDAGK